MYTVISEGERERGGGRERERERKGERERGGEREQYTLPLRYKTQLDHLQQSHTHNTRLHKVYTTLQSCTITVSIIFIRSHIMGSISSNWVEIVTLYTQTEYMYTLQSHIIVPKGVMFPPQQTHNTITKQRYRGAQCMYTHTHICTANCQLQSTCHTSAALRERERERER